jgi:hypothetical protein
MKSVNKSSAGECRSPEIDHNADAPKGDWEGWQMPL